MGARRAWMRLFVVTIPVYTRKESETRRRLLISLLALAFMAGAASISNAATLSLAADSSATSNPNYNSNP